VLCTYFLVAVLFLFLSRRHLGVPSHWSLKEVDLKLSLHLIREAVSFVFISVLSTLLLNSDIIILSKLQDETAVGLYRAALRVVQVGIMIIFGYATAIFPVMSRVEAQGSEGADLETLTNKSLLYLQIVLLPIATLGTVLAQPLSQLLFGVDYAGMESALQILLWTLLPVAVTQVLSRSIFARDRQHIIPWFLTLGVLLNLGLSLWWVPRGSYVATSWAILSARVLVATCTFGLALRCRAVDWDALRALGKPVLCALLLGGFLFLFKHAHPVILLTVGIGLYGGLLFLLRALPKEDVAVLWRMTRRLRRRTG
jgi:O-antigen/teichoic acid export membrane protein